MTAWSGNTQALWGEAALRGCYYTETSPAVQFSLGYFIVKVFVMITYCVNDNYLQGMTELLSTCIFVIQYFPGVYNKTFTDKMFLV